MLIKYPTLDRRIAETYAARSTATNKNSLYDSYIRAFRWASDRIGDQGVIAFVSNNGWVDGNTADGIRKTFADEFSDIWIYNLRGNQRTAGETSRREGGKVFGSGARTGVAVLIASKRPSPAAARIHYYGVADYQTQEQKLAAIDTATLGSVGWNPITPNQAGDWLNQRNDAFDAFPAIASKEAGEEGLRHFTLHTSGLKTNRDAWCYNHSHANVDHNMSRMVATYSQQAAQCLGQQGNLSLDSTQISWSRGLVRDALRGVQHQFKPDRIYTALYRPFTKQHAYFDRPRGIVKSCGLGD